MSRSLPSNPNLDQLKKQAKDLLKAFKAGDSSICEILRYHFRFARATDENMLKSEVTLQEMQHALALDYRFKSWKDLSDHVRSGKQPADESGSNREREMQIAFSKMGEMLRSGITFRPAVATVAGESRDRELSKAFAVIHDRAERGADVRDVLADFGDLFPRSIQLMWTAGHSGSPGQDHLPECCRRIAAMLAEDGFEHGSGAVEPSDIHKFFERCAKGVAEGRPLLRILRNFIKELGDQPMAEMVLNIGETVESGYTLSEALRMHHEFSPLCVAHVQAGEASGKLEDSLGLIVSSRAAYGVSIESAEAASTIRYVNMLLFEASKAEHPSIQLSGGKLPPKLTDPDGIVVATPSFQHTINRLKVMTGVSLVTHKKPVRGRLELSIRGEVYEGRAIFDDRVDSRSCELLLMKKGDGVAVLSSEEPRDILLNIMEGAVKGRASDMHFEWVDGQLAVRYRIDGRFQALDTQIPERQQQAVIDSLKGMCGMDIEDRMRPQNGRVCNDVEGKQVDFRVSIMPYVSGESAVVRILDRANTMLGLDNQSLTPATLEMLRGWMNRPSGMFFITGPAGSGKTTTLYSVLRELDPGERKIITCEEPVEYIIEGINQQNVGPDSGLPMRKAMREVMRQDPDVIMIGEIRDAESLTAAIEASLTGHLVFSSMHTSDAADGVRRLMSVAPDYHRLNSCLIGVMAQRLIRVVCPDCSEEYEPETWAKEALGGKADIRLFRGRGCDACKGMGYRGRTGAQELLEMKDELRNIVAQDGTVEQIRETAIASGMVTMRQDCLAKVIQGLTTLEEALRVC